MRRMLLLLFALSLACHVSHDGTGSVSVSHDFSAAAEAIPAPEAVTHFTFSGRDARGRTVYGPIQLHLDDTHRLERVPTSVQAFDISYEHGTGRVLALAQVPVAIAAGDTVQVRATPQVPDDGLKLQLVNDSLYPDSQVYVLLHTPEATCSVEAPKGFCVAGEAKATATALALSTLPRAGADGQMTLVSPHTGRTLPVYQVTIRDVVSGHLSVSYGSPFKIDGGHVPTDEAAYRWDKMELTYKAATRSGDGNLTSIDFFGIPMQVEVLHLNQAQADPLQFRTYHVATPTLLKMIKALSPTTLESAFRNLSGGTFKVTDTADWKTFARVKSPNAIAGRSKGSAAPWPGFSAYLKSLAGKSFRLAGEQYGGYDYLATVSEATPGNFEVACVGKLNVTPAKSGKASVPNLDTNLKVTVKLPAETMDYFIYACVPNETSCAIDGYSFHINGDVKQGIDRDRVDYAAGTAYGAIVGDVHAALNFGLVDGNQGSTTAGWYRQNLLPNPAPFGGARTTNDGFYNPYAAVIYNVSDAYGHPFSDRLASVSPLFHVDTNDTLRLTLLHDLRLDSPRVTVTRATSTTLELAWPAVAGTSRYEVLATPPLAAVPLVVTPTVPPADPQTCTLSGLQPGTPYVLSVTAVSDATVDQKTVRICSNRLEIQGVTTGERATLHETSADRVTWQAHLNTTLGNVKISVNGTELTPGTNAWVEGRLGLNVYDLTVKDAKGSTLFRSSFFLKLADSTTTANPNKKLFHVDGLAWLQGNKEGLTLGGTPPYINLEHQLVVSGSFIPKPWYQSFPVVLPAAGGSDSRAPEADR